MTATAKCDGFMAAAFFFLLWGRFWGRRRRISDLCTELDSQFCDLCYFFVFVCGLLPFLFYFFVFIFSFLLFGRIHINYLIGLTSASLIQVGRFYDILIVCNFSLNSRSYFST